MEPFLYKAYCDILHEELIPAMGCTEPIAVAYAAALAKQQISEPVNRVVVSVSPNIIKNVKSVVVPNTNGLRGITAAAASGIVAGDPNAELQVISKITADQIPEISRFMKETEIEVRSSATGFIFEIDISVFSENEYARCRILGFHTNVVFLQKNGEVLKDIEYVEKDASQKTDHGLLNVRNIIAFADEVNLDDVRDVLQRQIEYNMKIAEAGMTGEYGASIGKVLMAAYGNSVNNRAKAYAAAASDARMNGCSLPVVINSGSGNQGITTSVPVVIYAREMNVSHEQLLRALTVSNLVTIHLKTGIGRLSAYCGATSAGCGAAAGITYLYGGKEKEIAHTVVNAVAIDSGMICDGAKSSCAAKIASAVEAGLLGMQMYMHGTEFVGGDGIVSKGVENTIKNVGRVARLGMASTDKEIIEIMISQ